MKLLHSGEMLAGGAHQREEQQQKGSWQPPSPRKRLLSGRQSYRRTKENSGNACIFMAEDTRQQHVGQRTCLTVSPYPPAQNAHRSFIRSPPWVKVTNPPANGRLFPLLGGGLQSGLRILTLLVCYGLLQQLQAAADVGLEEGGFTPNDLESVITGEAWLLTGDKCTIGGANHLVVDPEFNENFLQPQILHVNLTGVALCKWLDAMYQFHMKRKSKWEARHKKEKATTRGFFSFFKRIQLHFRAFPPFTVQFKIHYLDIWHDDRFGKPMPWASGRFCYDTRETEASSYGLFALSTPPCFILQGTNGIVKQLGQATLVHLLLSPHPDVNRRMHQLERRVVNKLKETAVGVVSGLAAGAGVLMEQKKSLTIATPFMSSKGTLTVKTRDFWMRGATCYIRTRLSTIEVVGVTLCHEMYHEGAAGVYGALKAHQVNSVQLSIMNVDLFNHSEATFVIAVDEGLILPENHGVAHEISLQTDPAIIPEYVYAMRLGKAIRLPVVAGRTIMLAKQMLQNARKKD